MVEFEYTYLSKVEYNTVVFKVTDVGLFVSAANVDVEVGLIVDDQAAYAAYLYGLLDNIVLVLGWESIGVDVV